MYMQKWLWAKAAKENAITHLNDWSTEWYEDLYKDFQKGGPYNPLDATDRDGHLKYPKESLLFHAYPDKIREPFDYVIAQSVAEYVTCHMIARNKPSLKRKYTCGYHPELFHVFYQQ